MKTPKWTSLALSPRGGAEIKVAGQRLTVHQHIDYPDGEWFYTYGRDEKVMLENSRKMDIADAKRVAMARLRDKCMAVVMEIDIIQGGKK